MAQLTKLRKAAKIEPHQRDYTVRDRETWAPLPVLFLRVSLAALSSREPPIPTGGDPSPETPPGVPTGHRTARGPVRLPICLTVFCYVSRLSPPRRHDHT